MINSVNKKFKHGGWQVPTEIIMHHTVTPTVKSAINALKARGLSYHYLIDKDGSIYELVDPNFKAWHAKGYNNNTIGISFVCGGKYGPVNEEQHKASIWLINYLKTKHPINSLTGHKYRSAHGKIDPEGYDFERVAKETGIDFNK